MSEPLKPLLRTVIQYAKGYRPDGSSPPPPLAELAGILRLLATVDASDPGVSAQISALLTSLSISGLESDHRVLAVCAQEIRTHWAQPLLLSTQPDDDPVCDIVGTGGDGFDTFNVSTASAIVAAGAGLKVCKVRRLRVTFLSGYD